MTAFAGLMVSSCVSDDVVTENTDPKGGAITFSASVGRSTRATEIKIGNLGDFGVFARGVNPSQGTFLDNFVIGETNPEIAKRYNAREEASDRWDLNTKIYWPSDVSDVLFWGFTSRINTDEEYPDTFGGNGKLGFNKDNGPELKGFSPKRSTRKNGDNYLNYLDGNIQRDLVVAFTHVHGATSNVNLNFEHALSQIKIWAKGGTGNNNHRIVKIKGAWIVNASSIGDLSANYKFKDNESTDDFSCGHTWEPKTDSHVAYGSFHETPITLTTDPKSILSANNIGSLMLIPQKVKPWEGKQPGITFENVNTQKAYILLYCRIEAFHGSKETDDYPNTPTDKTDMNASHTHQLFPHTDKWDENAYGYTCVPIEIDWQRGKIYKYVLDICGPSTGGGVYPPNLPDSIPPGITPPDGKVPGDPILDEPIKFQVSVSDWDDEWKNGNEIPM